MEGEHLAAVCGLYCGALLSLSFEVDRTVHQNVEPGKRNISISEWQNFRICFCEAS